MPVSTPSDGIVDSPTPTILETEAVLSACDLHLWKLKEIDEEVGNLLQDRFLETDMPAR